MEIRKAQRPARTYAPTPRTSQASSPKRTSRTKEDRGSAFPEPREARDLA